MKTVLLLLMCFHVSSAMKHSLKYLVTVSFGVPDFPEFLASAMVDEVRLGFCDNKTNKVVSHKWIRDLEKDDRRHNAWYSQECLENRSFFKKIMDGIMKNLNQSGGSHFLQWTAGCEWDDETNETSGFLKYGYNGEDFIEVDLQSMKWTGLKPEALTTKLSWDMDRARLEKLKSIYIYRCPPWLKRYLHYGRRSVLRTELPSVSLLQKSPSSPVTCFATGFYPKRAAVFWRKDGEELHEDVEYGEILPNHDETFQMRVNLNISAVKPEDWWRYECVFQLHGVKEDIITKLDKAVIRSNYEPPPGFPVSAVTGVVAGLVLLSVCILGLLMLRRKNNGEQEIHEERPGVH